MFVTIIGIEKAVSTSAVSSQISRRGGVLPPEYAHHTLFQIIVGDAELADFSCLSSIPQGSAL